MRIVKKYLLLSLVFLIGFALDKTQAQNENPIDTVFVQTTRIPLPVKETGRNITIIQGEELQNMSFTALDDLLQYIPGIEVQSRNAFGAQGDISMRGATYTQVLMLVDGMKLNDPLTGHFNGYIPVTPAEIERIEVLRGAASAMYGADAVGGVINIITKGFSFKNTDETEVSGQVNYGQHRLVNAQQGFSVRKDRFYMGGGFHMNQADGETIPAQQVGDVLLDEYRNFFNLKTFGLSAGYQFNNDWRLQLRSAFDDRNFSARYFYTSSTFDKSVETTRNWWNQLQLSNTGVNNSTDFNLAYRNGTDEFIFSPDFPSTNLHTSQFWNLNVNHLRIINDQFSLKAGVQIDRREIESTDRGNHMDMHYGIYAMGVYRPGNGLNMTGSLRLDYDDNYELEFTPQLNISYTLSNLTLRAAAGRSIRAADYTERFVSFNLENLTPGRSLGNPNLIAESGWSEELGFDVELGKNWTLKSTGFLRQSANLIDYVPTNADVIPNNQNLQTGETYFYANNITDVQTFGIEIESWWKKTLGERKHVLWSLGYTYLNTTNDADVISVYISSHARHLLNTNLVLNLDKFQLALNGLYKARDERQAAGINATLNPNYNIWNLKLGYQITPQFGFQLQVHNLLDEDYQDILGAQMPGRWLMGGIKFNL